MRYYEEKPAVLLLEDGKAFYGKAAGKIGITTGEVCFNTGMTGYQEIFTDPSYFGQIMVCTNVHIGNYGIKEDESQSENVKIAGLVVRNYTERFSRKMADSSIQDFLLRENLVGMTDVDTRELVLYIRSQGAMNAIISSETQNLVQLGEILKGTPIMNGLELSSTVCTEHSYTLGEDHTGPAIAVLDLGVKTNILNNLLNRNCRIKVFPAKTPFEELAAWQPDAYFISNGPGDPAAMDYAVETTRAALDSDKPLFGICLGHQLFAKAMNVGTFKMHNGHRGLNHPVKNLITGKCEITSQNHGFGIIKDDLDQIADLEITHINLNDGSVEGIRHKFKPAFSVQYHPEAAPGPNDASYLFDFFIQLIEESKAKNN
ncbi:MAG: glutamine-hydrolyzing carbamoyl-phosphate synthase small subunit [Bacteroidota bacterium]|nr:glutamine-hydrolyzing carbamoyl-phosphate synthase small subunit [Bacteroidota bacterium]